MSVFEQRSSSEMDLSAEDQTAGDVIFGVKYILLTTFTLADLK